MTFESQPAEGNGSHDGPYYSWNDGIRMRKIHMNYSMMDQKEMDIVGTKSHARYVSISWT